MANKEIDRILLSVLSQILENQEHILALLTIAATDVTATDLLRSSRALRQRMRNHIEEY